MAERLRVAVEQYAFECAPVTVSVGVATLPPLPRVAEVLIRTADHALYRAKREGKNRVLS